MRRDYLLSIFSLLLFGSLLLNIMTIATTYGASSYVFESDLENDFFVTGEWDGWFPDYPSGELSRGTVTDGYPVFNGSYSAKAAGMGWGTQKMLYKNLGVQLEEIYVRTYVYFPRLYTYPHQDTGIDCYWIYFMAIVPAVPIPSAYNNPSQPAWVSGFLRVYYDAQLGRYVFTGGKYDGSQGNRYYIPAGTQLGAIQAERWYYMEWYHKMASGPGVRDGIWRLYVDDLVQGESHIYYEDTEVPNYEPNGPYFGAVLLGNFETPGSQDSTTPTPTMYFDSVKVSDQFIGPESEAPPIIGSPIQEPKTVISNQSVTVSVNVTDESGVREVILSYSTDEGATWTNKTMNSVFGNVYEGDIPGFPFGTNVSYLIIAYDTVGKVSVKSNAGQYYVYSVIPEFSTWPMFLATLILFTIFVVFTKKRLPSSRV